MQSCSCSLPYEKCCGARRQASITDVGTANPLPPWPTIEEIRKAVREELRSAGLRG